MRTTKRQLRRILKEGPRLEKDPGRLAQLRAKLDDALEQMGLEPGYSTREGWEYSLEQGIEVMESLTNQWPDRPDRGYRIVMIVGEPPPELPPENTRAKGTHLRLVGENNKMKITRKQLRRIIRESILCEQDLKGFATTVAAYAFEEDGAMPDMSDPADLEWIATSDKEIQRIGQKYRQADDAKAFLSLSVEERKELLKEAIDPREMEEPLGGWAGNALTNDPELDPFKDYDRDAVRAAAHTVEKIPYPQGGMIENEIHHYLENELGLDPVGDEIFAIADEALSIAGIMLGVGPDAL